MPRYRLSILIVLMIVCLTGCSLFQGPDDSGDKEKAAELASGFIADLTEEDYDSAYSLFDDTMRNAISREELEELWDSLVTQVGPFMREVEQRDESQPPYQIVIVTIQMGSIYLDTRVVFNRDFEIAGLFFQPSDYLAQFYEVPDYADETQFTEEEVTVGSGEWALPGTLTIPVGEGPHPFVVLVHGSGAHDRNETIGPNRPFQDLAWGLASKGIGVLRYEKRNFTHGQKMAALVNSLTPHEEVVEDAAAAVALLKSHPKVESDAIYVLGHSLGAMLAPRIATESGEAAGMILLAGTPRGLEDLVVEQVTYLLTLKDEVTEADEEALNLLIEQAERVKSPDLSLDTPEEDLPMGVPAAYWLYLREYDAVAEIRELDLPVLILQGERDYQVTLKDFAAWKDGLEGQSGIVYQSYDSLNHLFMPGDGPPNPDEYMEPSNVDLRVIEDIAEWITNR